MDQLFSRPQVAPPPAAPTPPVQPQDTDSSVRRAIMREDKKQGTGYFMIDLMAGENAAGLQGGGNVQ